MRWILVAAITILAGCEAVPMQTSQPPQQPPETQIAQSDSQISNRARTAARAFVQVVETVEPVAERECRSRAPQANCDFRIVVDDRPGQPPNAFQTLDRSGRPVIAFNLALIASAQNADELAFVMGHESAHHILGHLARTRDNAIAGAVIFSGLTALTGGSADAARSYSKDFELEADELGTIITARAGYNPVRGSQFFGRIPDPGNKFLGSHPPNAARMELVRRTASQL